MKVIKRLAQQAEGRQWQLSRFARMMKVRLGALLLSPYGLLRSLEKASLYQFPAKYELRVQVEHKV